MQVVGSGADEEARRAVGCFIGVLAQPQSGVFFRDFCSNETLLEVIIGGISRKNAYVELRTDGRVPSMAGDAIPFGHVLVSAIRQVVD